MVTGAAGFIGYHISQRLLEEGWRVVGLDCMSDYYDVSLKERRESLLLQNTSYRSEHEKVETPKVLMKLFEEERPDVVIHLAAQAGVRYSIENPRAYLESNINGTFELLEAARAYPPDHMLLASTSSVYGANEALPYHELDKADHQMSFYAATKKSTENMAHSYAHLFGLPITMFRFFTVYGPWGRPDMALFKFIDAIKNGKPIDVYNKGHLFRDFTYIDDLINCVYQLIECQPEGNVTAALTYENDSLSPVAPFRVVNIGNDEPISLMDFIANIEEIVGIKAKLNLQSMQPGDVYKTWADVRLLKTMIGNKPETSVIHGIQRFYDWYKKYYSEEGC